MVKVSYDIHGNLKFWEILHLSIIAYLSIRTYKKLLADTP